MNEMDIDMEKLLSKLQALQAEGVFENPFTCKNEVIAWGNKIASLMRMDSIPIQLRLQFAVNFDLLKIPQDKNYYEAYFGQMQGSIDQAIETLKLVIKDRAQNEIYFPKNSPFDIQSTMNGIFSKAEKSIWVCDNYVDEMILNELVSVKAINIKILTSKPKNNFKARLLAIQQQFPDKKIEVKTCDDNHDRFYFIDENKVWTLGSSLKDAGKKPTVLSEINEANGKKIISDFDKWWEMAAPFK